MKRVHIFLIAWILIAVACNPEEGAAPLAPESETPSQPAAEPTAEERIEMTKWDIWSSGEVMLRGINIHQRLIYAGWDDPEQYGEGPVDPPFAQEDFDQMADLIGMTL